MPSDEDATQTGEDDDAAVPGGFDFASVSQIYETTIHADGVPSIRFVSVPRRVLELETSDFTDRELGPAFGFVQFLNHPVLFITPFSPSELPWAIFQMPLERVPKPRLLS